MSNGSTVVAAATELPWMETLVSGIEHVSRGLIDHSTTGLISPMPIPPA
jgi:hypothetical protein